MKIREQEIVSKRTGNGENLFVKNRKNQKYGFKGRVKTNRTILIMIRPNPRTRAITAIASGVFTVLRRVTLRKTVMLIRENKRKRGNLVREI